MEQRVLKFIREQNMLQAEDRVLVGISGGADSVCLLFMLNKLKTLLGIDVYALHVNHSFRGQESDEDEAYAEQFCRQLGVPFEAVRVDMCKRAEEEKLSLEEAGRKLRYEVFEMKARQWNCNKIAVAHHADDCAETVLFQLFRGSGLKGIAGIPSMRQSIIRPLLCIERAEIEQYLKENQICFRVDSTNLCNDYSRNKIRNQIVPLIKEEINEEAVLHILQLAETAGRADAYFEKKAVTLMAQFAKIESGRLILFLQVFCEERIVTEYVLRACIREVQSSLKDISKQHIDAVYGLFEKTAGKYIVLPSGLHVKRVADAIIFEHVVVNEGVLCENTKTVQEKETVNTEPLQIRKAEISLESPPVIIKKMGYEVQFRCFLHKKIKNIPKKTYTKWFDYDTISDVFCLRSRLTGDYLVIDEVGNRKKLQRYLIDEKIPKEMREDIMLLANGNEIIWAVGYRISEAYKVKEDTRIVLEVQITEDKRNG